MRLGENAPRQAFDELALAISIPRAEQLEIGLPFCHAFRSGMSTLTDMARSAAHVDGWIVIRMASTFL
jgi:hypothetical protein